MIPCRAVLTF
uniref:Solute carrier family 7 member 2 n=2 Tax=Rodentia TaxID=9989 RepID=A0A286Y5K1_CAVPO